MPIRILVTGSRNWTDRAAIHHAITQAIHGALTLPRQAPPGAGQQARATVVHGGARGADALAGSVARQLGLAEEVHPADWNRYGRAAGHRRNAEMVAAGADICLAFPLGESRGTRGCMALAARAGIQVVDASRERGAENGHG